MKESSCHEQAMETCHPIGAIFGFVHFKLNAKTPFVYESCTVHILHAHLALQALPILAFSGAFAGEGAASFPEHLEKSTTQQQIILLHWNST